VRAEGNGWPVVEPAEHCTIARILRCSSLAIAQLSCALRETCGDGADGECLVLSGLQTVIGAAVLAGVGTSGLE
jgi:hypothetical protein